MGTVLYPKLEDGSLSLKGFTVQKVAQGRIGEEYVIL